MRTNIEIAGILLVAAESREIRTDEAMELWEAGVALLSEPADAAWDVPQFELSDTIRHAINKAIPA